MPAPLRELCLCPLRTPARKTQALSAFDPLDTRPASESPREARLRPQRGSRVQSHQASLPHACVTVLMRAYTHLQRLTAAEPGVCKDAWCTQLPCIQNAMIQGRGRTRALACHALLCPWQACSCGHSPHLSLLQGRGTLTTEGDYVVLSSSPLTTALARAVMTRLPTVYSLKCLR